MQYYVLGNLNHDNKAYTRGDVVELEKGSQAATNLLDTGIISKDPIPEVVVPRNRDLVVEKGQKPEVGGEPVETGEPSIDGRDDQGSSSEAEDITPVVSEKMTRQELEDLAREKGIDEKEIEDAPNKGVLVDLITNASEPSEPTDEPEADPSANL